MSRFSVSLECVVRQVVPRLQVRCCTHAPTHAHTDEEREREKEKRKRPRKSERTRERLKTHAHAQTAHKQHLCKVMAWEVLLKSAKLLKRAPSCTLRKAHQIVPLTCILTQNQSMKSTSCHSAIVIQVKKNAQRFVYRRVWYMWSVVARLAMVGAAVRKRLILHILRPVFKVHGQPLQLYSFSFTINEKIPLLFFFLPVYLFCSMYVYLCVLSPFLCLCVCLK